MVKQGMLQEGLLQLDEYNRDKNDVLAIVTQDSEAEWPSLTLSKLIFLQVQHSLVTCACTKINLTHHVLSLLTLQIPTGC